MNMLRAYRVHKRILRPCNWYISTRIASSPVINQPVHFVLHLCDLIPLAQETDRQPWSVHFICYPHFFLILHICFAGNHVGDDFRYTTSRVDDAVLWGVQPCRQSVYHTVSNSLCVISTSPIIYTFYVHTRNPTYTNNHLAVVFIKGVRHGQKSKRGCATFQYYRHEYCDATYNLVGAKVIEDALEKGDLFDISRHRGNARAVDCYDSHQDYVFIQ